jgi:hypothetical protein
MICSLYFIFLQDHSIRFGCRPHPSSGVHKTVVTSTGTSLMIVQLPHFNVATLEWGSCTIIWLVPVDVIKVLCTPDDGCGRHPKQVGWSCSKIKYRLHIVASRWTFTDTDFYSTFRQFVSAIIRWYHNNVRGKVYRGAGLSIRLGALKYTGWLQLPIKD